MGVSHGITINHPMVDWLTLTSRDKEFYKFWRRRIDKGTAPFVEKNIPRYRGIVAKLANGNVSSFVGEQNGESHYMVHLSGEVANEDFLTCANQVQQGIAKCTRIDIQVTAVLPDDWSQFKLLVEMKRKRRTVGWYESKDRDGSELSTVYIGSRKADRFIRVYVKPFKGDRNGLRFEIQHNQARAGAAFRSLLDPRGFNVAKREILSDRIVATKSDKLAELYLPIVGKDGRPVRVTVAKSDDTTVQWLLFQCLPALERILNSHGEPDSIARHFQAALDRHNRRLKNGYSIES